MSDQLDFDPSHLNYLFEYEARKAATAPASNGDIGLQLSNDYESMLLAHFHREVIHRNYHHQATNAVPVAPQSTWGVESLARKLPDDGYVERSCYQTERNVALVVSGERWLGWVHVEDAWCRINIYSTTPERAAEVHDHIMEAVIFRTTPSADFSYRVWNAEEGAEYRRMGLRRWSTIENNYAGETRSALAQLMSIDATTPRGGQVIIWHGEPGTGKTNALMALMSEWSTWCKIELITDPEVLLNKGEYLNRVISRRSHDKKARLLIFEDVDGLVVNQGDGSRSAGMARLLNLADGILGIDQDIMVLFTTNVPPSALDAALSRPGRCLAHTKFRRFEVHELVKLFPLSLPNPTRSMTLAEVWRATNEQVNIFDEGHPFNTAGTYL